MSTQLRNYKEEKYGNSQVSLLLSADELADKMRDSMSVSTADFVTSALGRIYDCEDSSGRDFCNFASILGALPGDARKYVKRLSSSTEHAGVVVLCDVVDHFITTAAECFPKRLLACLKPRLPTRRGSFDTPMMFSSRSG